VLRTETFRKIVWEYYVKNKRAMPWRETRDPYRILVSEIMLQQTQVERVIPKYEAFIKKFPSFVSLSRAKVADVLTLWQGLGYNRRALNLKRAALEIVEKHGGEVPTDLKALDALPGIGHATAGAIVVYAFNKPVVYIETNVRSVYIHFFFPKIKKISDTKIEKLVLKTLNTKNPREWYYALMDYGAMLKRTHGNPNIKSSHYIKQTKFKGSKREVRGKIVRLLTQKKGIYKRTLLKTLELTENKGMPIIFDLEKEGFLKVMRKKIVLA
jgi:A/G-specific adenine glycosylase